MEYQLKGKKVWVAGHKGMVGSALVRRLESEHCIIQTVDRSEIDLMRQADVEEYMASTQPDVVIVAAAKVGGILANDTYPADFLYDNLMIESNIIHTSHSVGVEKLLFLGSSCIYPKLTEQPINESALLTGLLEPTNEWYAIAKIAGIKLTQAYRKQHGCDFISAMPTNLYGPGDNYDLNTSHVLPALIRKAHMAKKSGQTSLEVWGSGQPLREFMHADDCADALVFLLKNYSDSEHVNVGVGKDISIGDLAALIAGIVGFEGNVLFDRSKPDGTMKKLLDTSKLAGLGWESKITLTDGITSVYEEFLRLQS